jgi:hypothetical protein
MALFLIIEPVSLVIDSFNDIPLKTVPLPLIGTPHALIYFPILIKIFPLTLFHPINQLSFIPLPLMVNVHSIPMIIVILPIPQVNISFFCLKDANPLPDAIINNLTIVPGIILKLNGLDVGEHVERLLKRLDFHVVL